MREVREIMAELSATGLTPDQVALVMELSASLSVAARPIVDVTALRRRQKDRDRKRAVGGNPQKSAETVESAETPNSTPILDKESVPQTPFKEINPTPYTETRARKAVEFPCPERVDPAHWCDFLLNRKAKRLPNTATAYAGQVRKLAELTDDEWPPGRIVQFCVEKGWGSINDPRESEHRNGTGRLPQRAAESIGIGPTQAAVLQVKAQLRSAGQSEPGRS